MDRGTLDCAAWGAVHCMALSLAGTRRVRYAYPRTRRVLLATFALTHKPYGYSDRRDAVHGPSGARPGHAPASTRDGSRVGVASPPPARSLRRYPGMILCTAARRD